jgi:hypothetical protein
MKTVTLIGMSWSKERQRSAQEVLAKFPADIDATMGASAC